MKKLYFMSFLLIYLSNAYSQSREVSVSHSSYKLSGTYFLIPDIFTYEEINYTSNYNLLDINFGYYFPIISPTNNMSLGLNATGQLGFLYNAKGDVSDKVKFDFGLPVTVNFKIGAGSNKLATIPVGLGLGFGYRPNLLIADGNLFKNNKDEIFYSFFRPYITFEIAFDFQKGNRGIFDNLKIQFAFQPALKHNYFDYDAVQPYDNTLEYFSISIIKFSSFK